MNTKDVKDIKITNTDTKKVISNNETLWKKVELLKPDYEFFDSEIGKNSNWADSILGDWWLRQFVGQNVVYVRHYIIQNKNKLGRNVDYIYTMVPTTRDANGYGFYFYGPEPNSIEKSENIVFPMNGYNDNTYKTYVFVCNNKYSEEFKQKLIDFANSL